MMTVLLRAKGLALVALLTVALVATAFAHRLPSPQDQALQAYVASGGLMADLCTEPGEEGSHPSSDCPACQIASNLLPPMTAPALRKADLVFVATVVAPRESRALRHLPDPAHSSQSPPLA